MGSTGWSLEARNTERSVGLDWGSWPSFCEKDSAQKGAGGGMVSHDLYAPSGLDSPASLESSWELKNIYICIYLLGVWWVVGGKHSAMPWTASPQRYIQFQRSIVLRLRDPPIRQIRKLRPRLADEVCLGSYREYMRGWASRRTMNFCLWTVCLILSCRLWLRDCSIRF